MTSCISPAPLEFELKPSRGLAIYLVVLYLTAGLVASLVPPLAPWGVLLTPFLLLGALRTWRRYGRDVPLAIALGEQGWRLHFAQEQRRGELYRVHLQPWMLALWFRLDDGRRQKLLICADQLDPQAFRRLRVAVRFASPAE